MTSCILNATSNRILAICHLLSHPPYVDPDIHWTVTDIPGISLEHKTWGSLAMFDVSDLPASQSFLTTRFPEYPNIAEIQLVRTALLMELTPVQPDIRRLANTIFQEEQWLAHLANELFQIRSEQHAIISPGRITRQKAAAYPRRRRSGAAGVRQHLSYIVLLP